MRTRVALSRHWLFASLLLAVVALAALPVAAQAATVTPLEPGSQPKFVNPLPDPLSPGFIYKPTGATYVNGQLVPLYRVKMQQFEQALGIVDPLTGAPLSTTVWGYGTSLQAPTYPGRTFIVNKPSSWWPKADAKAPIAVRWVNGLVDANGQPLPHLLSVDPTIHWALHEMEYPELYDGVYPDWQDVGVPLVTHLHGGHNRSQFDGLPDAWSTPGNALKGRLFNGGPYVYYNDQEGGTIWYHDHALGITRLNVYAGLAGFYIIRDQNERALSNLGYIPRFNGNTGVPVGGYEIPLAIQDREFDLVTDDNGKRSAQLSYPAAIEPEFFGDFVLVNGQAWPYLDVEPRQYRFRILNGSDSRVYNLALSNGAPFYQIGTDDGLMDRPAQVTELTVMPGERADVIVDFSRVAGQTIVMTNDANIPYPDGDPIDPDTVGQIMAFKVVKPLNTNIARTNVLKWSPYKAPLRPVWGPIKPLQPTVTRQVGLFEGLDDLGRITPRLGFLDKGPQLWDVAQNTLDTQVNLGTTEMWAIYNTTVDAHPVHLHETSFQVVGRQPFTFATDPDTGDPVIPLQYQLTGPRMAPAANEAGWKDTVRALPGEVTYVVATFDLLGEYVWHCHILSHEDNEMMLAYKIVTGGAPAPTYVAPTP